METGNMYSGFKSLICYLFSIRFIPVKMVSFLFSYSHFLDLEYKWIYNRGVIFFSFFQIFNGDALHHKSRIRKCKMLSTVKWIMLHALFTSPSAHPQLKFNYLEYIGVMAVYSIPYARPRQWRHRNYAYYFYNTGGIRNEWSVYVKKWSAYLFYDRTTWLTNDRSVFDFF